jgi:hypothetical protein
MTAARTLMLIAGSLALSACGGNRPAPVSASAPIVVRPAPPPVFRAPPPGDPVLGQSAGAVGALLGSPRLDVKEGAGRKLQFSGGGCVIDVFFYAPRAGGEPVATHIDARGLDGRDADRAYCIAALKAR